MGVDLSDTLHSSLSKAEPFLEMADLDYNTKPLLTSLVLLDTMDCFVHRQKPTVRIKMPKAKSMDRHLGLCLSLLPYYYDLYELNHGLAINIGEECLAHILHHLDGVHAAVDNGNPINRMISSRNSQLRRSYIFSPKPRYMDWRRC